MGWTARAAACLWVGIGLLGCGSSSSTSKASEVVEGVEGTDVGVPPALPDAGAADVGVDAGPPPPPRKFGDFTHYDKAHGLPTTVLDVSADGAGNVWVAGGEGLYLLRPGAAGFQKFTQAEGLQEWGVQSVAGLGAGELVVGYKGVFGGAEDNDPEWMLLSGGIAHVKLQGDRVEAKHYVVGSPPGTSSSYPDGRYKVRTVWVVRPVLSGKYEGNVWLGGTHGVALWNWKTGAMREHIHYAITGVVNGESRFMSGDYWGLALAPDDSIWIGNAHRVSHLDFATQGFSQRFDTVLDVWPDADRVNRTDDNIKALAVGSGGVWIGSLTNNLAFYDTTAKTYQFWTRADGTPDKSVTALAMDPDGSLWVGSWIGVGRYRPSSDSWTYYNSITARLPSDSVTSIQIDTRTTPRTVYIGTAGGVSIYRGE